jgi:uncharacterized protein YbjT (DUF2867 family)
MLVVTGATGTVGAVVLRELAAAGLPVRALGSRPTALPAGAQWRPFSFTEPQTWPAAFAGASGLFLMRPPQLVRVARDVLPAVAGARQAGVARVVFLSVLGAERVPLLPHRRIERWLDASDMATVHLRAANFMQNLLTVHAGDIRERDALVLPAGEAGLSYVDARDVGAVAARCLVEDGHAGRAYEPTGPAALSHREIAEILSEVLARPIRYRRTGPVGYWRHARRTAMPRGPALASSLVYTAARFGVGSRVSGDVEGVLGRPATTFHDFALAHRTAWASR